MSQKKVAIVLVNYNGIKDTIECVKSIKESTYNDYQIIIVENDSNDKEEIKDNEYLNENTIIFFSECNMGFSGGNNLAIKYALENNYEYILLLNNDTTVDKEFLRHLIEASIEYDAGIVTGNIYFYYDKSKLWYSAGEYDYETGQTMMCGKKMNSQIPVEVNFATGCLLLITRRTLERCGMLSDEYFLYSEDTDFCCNALKNSEKIVWTPYSRIYHKVSASTKENSPFQEYYLIRNNLIITKKYGTKKLRAYANRTWKSIKEVLKGNYKVEPLVNAWMDFLQGKTGRSSKY